MRGVDHKRFGRYVAMQTYKSEMKRRGLQRTELSDAIARAYSDWIGGNIAVLPDILEPANGPNHRRLFHSSDAYHKIEEWKRDIMGKQSGDWQIDVGLVMALSAYQSHIVLDSKTTKGVPDYGWVWTLLKVFNRRNN